MYINFLHHVDSFPNFIMWFIALLPVSVGYRPSASQRGERKMRKIILASILGLALLSSGCAAMMSRALMNTDSRTPQKELDFNRTITKDVLAAYESLSGKEGASIKGIVKAIDREANRAHKAGDPSVAAMLSNQLSRPIVEQGLQTGFEWTADKKRQPLFNEPDDSYGGAVWGEAVPQLTGANVTFAIRARVVLLRDLGSCLSPDNAFQHIQGLETLPLRFKQHCSNAEKIVEFLQTQKNVERVIYPTLYEGEVANRAKKYFKGGNGALVGIELKDGVEAGKKFIDSLKLHYHVANIGDARSLAIHPATTTHSQLTEKELLAAGVTPGYVRLSVGIEHPDDIIADLKQALESSGKDNLKAVS